MATKSKKTEHSGSKKGLGAYFGRKKDAKKESNRQRRVNSKKVISESTTATKSSR